MCPMCGGETRSHVPGRPDLSLQRCQLCGIVFLPLQSSAAEYARQMETEFFSDGFAARHNGWQARFDHWKAHQTLRRLHRFVHTGRLLEVGVGSGVFLNAASLAGFDCTGIEASRHLADHVRRAYKLPVVQGYLEDFGPATRQPCFDIIVMNHVLEHMPDPKAMLRRISALLNKGGILHISVPNVAAWEATLPGWTSYEPYHLYYFSPATLLPLLRNSDLRALQVETVEPFSGWFNALARTIMGVQYQKIRTPESSTLTGWRFSFAFNALNLSRVGFGAVTLPFRYIQAIVNRGEELIAVATKE
jgi:2-polyprenyl-3-methyl-5-hydroxy-6-metoxy-1,4-benzoquinol methylase